MIELNSARIIRETRQTKHYLAISSAELRFVTAYKGLSDGEKLIWITIADHCALDPNYSCTLTQSQIANHVGKTIGTVTRAIANLRTQGFLQSESASASGGPLAYFLSLPQDGHQALLTAPSRQSVKTAPLSKTLDPSSENDRSPLAKTLDILIYNNKINNIKHNHNSHSDFSPVDNPTPETPVLDADALICDYKNLQEKNKNLPLRKQIQHINAHFSPEERIKIYEHERALNAVKASEMVTSTTTEPTPAFKAKLEQAAPVPQSRLNRSDIKLIEFELEGELFLVEEEVRNKILNKIPNLYQQNKILGAARQKPINTLLKEILFYVAKASSKTLDACQLKRFHTARKLCQKGVWERPNGLERQASIHREQQWQQVKKLEYSAAVA